MAEMNISPTMTQFASQMLTQLPLLLVYAAGIIVCAIRWRRAPTAALLAMIGTSIVLLATVIFAFLSAFLINQRMTAGAPAAQLGNTLTIMAAASSIMRGLGFALVLVAVFAQRQYGDRGFDVALTGSAQPR